MTLEDGRAILRRVILSLSEGIRENVESLTKAYSKYQLAAGK